MSAASFSARLQQTALDPLVAFGLLPLGHETDEARVERLEVLVPLHHGRVAADAGVGLAVVRQHSLVPPASSMAPSGMLR